MTVEYNVEKLVDCLEEIKPLLESHYKEIAMYQDKIELNPDYDKYLTLCDSGVLHIVTARYEGVLVGYFVSLVLPHLHYQDHMYAANDILFIAPEYRNAKVGLSLFKYAEEALKELGVSVLTVHMKTLLPFDSLCEGLGYDYAERSYTKFIGE